MQDLRIRVVHGFVQKFSEPLVELFRGVEALLRVRQQLRLDTHARGARGGDGRRLLIELHANGSGAHVERPQLFVVFVRFRIGASEKLRERGDFPRLEPQLGDADVIANRGGESRQV